MSLKIAENRPDIKKSLPGGNIYDKYNAKNPLYKIVVNRFLNELESVFCSLENVKSVLEVGTGDGFLLNRIGNLKKLNRLEGIDLSAKIIEKARVNYPSLKFSVGSVYNLPFKDAEFDLVIACEALEHLLDSRGALHEIRRVTRKSAIISVPLEPLWRILNMARGSYLFSFGNTPGHIRHWDKRDFRKLMEKYFIVERISYPLPWQLALLKK